MLKRFWYCTDLSRLTVLFAKRCSQLEAVYFICLCLGLGIVSGFLGGLLGIGGGVVLVPALALYYEYTQAYPPAQILIVSVATSLACIGFTSASAALAQHRAGKVNWGIFRRLVGFFLLGSFLAGFIAPLLPADVFRGFIGLFLAFVAVVMISRWQPDPHREFPGVTGSVALGIGGGVTAGLAGIAGGNVIVPSLVYFNTPVHTATATSSALGVPIAFVGALGYVLSSFSGGTQYVNWIATVPIIIGALLTAPLGVRVAHRLPAAGLKRAFGVLLIFVSLRLLAGLFD
jgi:uncharacterized membrane protein YfcA